jgi:DNA-binding LacI/PurR family transcriptional regulator
MEFYSILQNNESAISSVLKTLSGMGHRKIGMPYFQQSQESWRPHFSLTRKNLFSRAAANDFPEINLITTKMAGAIPGGADEKIWNARQWTSSLHMMEDLLARIAEKKDRHPSSAVTSARPSREDIIAYMPFLAKLITEDGITAIVGSNDYYSCQFYVWLSYLNINVPRDISLISFDNSALIRQYPIATVDWGYAHMAYCAVHILVGDIPIAHNSEKVMYSKTRLIDRGSLAQARTRELVL